MKTYENLRIHPLLDRIPMRLADAMLSMLRPADTGLRDWIDARLSSYAGSAGAILGDPLIESMYRWQSGERTVGELEADGTLQASFVESLEHASGDYRFPRDRRLFTHQLAALESTSAGKSILVSAGTGAGKTESFLFPILNDLCQQSVGSKATLEGVQALFIYPLNALIRSQKERLVAWLEAHEGRHRFALYNGDMKNSLPADNRRKFPLSEVPDRERLRQSPPPLLITNTTMLELMLVRPDDRPILEKSVGKLRWIVIDEAHSYTGSQAAELTLLLRRTLQAFNVNPHDVRFIATSATIGDQSEESTSALKKFLADVAGCDEDQVDVIRGHREIPALGALAGSAPSLQELEAQCNQQDGSAAELVSALRRSPVAMAIRSLLIERSVATLSEIKEHAGLASMEEAARWVDVASSGKVEDGSEADGRFLPVRAHFFQRTIDGVWACVNSDCAGRPSVPPEDWRYGALFGDFQRECSHCGSLVLEVSLCNDCGGTALRGVLSSDRKYVKATRDEEDEFLADVEASDDELTESAKYKEVILSSQADNIAKVDVGDARFNPISGEIASLDGEIAFAGIVWNPYDPQGQGYKREASRPCRCPRCGASNADPDKSRRSIRLAAPFSLSNVVPELLSAAPPDPKAVGDDVLMKGRRLLMFTDSRQGTARGAARLYDGALRDYIRHVVPELLPRPLSDEKREFYAKKKSRLASDLEHAESEAEREDIEQDLLRVEAALSGRASVSWPEVQAKLAQQRAVEKSIAPYFFDLMGREEQGQVARLLLLRELYRRPKRTNSLETLGLVSIRYPGVERIHAAEIPRAWVDIGGSLQEWKDFLKIYLDFVIRENACVDLSNDEKDWIGTRFSRKFLVDEIKKDQKQRYLWPKLDPESKAGRRSRLSRLLSSVFPGIRDLQISDVLQTAKSSLLGSGHLAKGDQPGHYLDWSTVELARPTKLWLCPVTRRLLDTTLRDVSPYHQGSDGATVVACEPVTLPIPPYVLWERSGLSVPVVERESWLLGEKKDHPLQTRGLWPEALDRALIGSEFYAAREHSAQIDQTRLDKLTGEFQSGKLNVLSCSTTMEMGVDIGSLAVVAMANPPPTVANYLQRAGRAGRRGETRALAYTVCRSEPRSLAIFNSPGKFLSSPISPPVVQLGSPVIVQRHLNAWLLRDFLMEKGVAATDGALRMKAGEFFGISPPTVQGQPGDDRRNESTCKRLMAYLQDTANYTEDKRQQILGLLDRSSLVDVELAVLLESARESFESAESGWYQEWDAAKQQWDEVPENGAAKKALTYRLKRLCDEYLLQLLTVRGALPARGFPVDVRELIIVKPKVAGDETDRKAMSNRSLSRELPVALREYQPGASVVVGGAVYKVGGLTMNWQRPADSGAAGEIQNLRWRLVCAECSEVTDSPVRPVACSACGSLVEDGARNRFEYIVPAGFVVPLEAKPNDDISRPTYVPGEVPLFSIRNRDGSHARRRMLRNQMGWVRVGRSSEVYHQSRGQDGSGFTLCLGCGWSSAGRDQSATDGASSHRQPFTGKYCEASINNPWMVRYLDALGATTRTDVLEYLLVPGVDGTLLQESDAAVASTLSVLLRKVIARRLSVDSSEIGFATQKVLLRGSRGLAVLVYDTASGGAGYVSGLEGHAEELLSEAIAEAGKCPANCDSACPECLLGHDTRDVADKLDRHAVTRVFGGQFKGTLLVPQAAKDCVGNDAAWEVRSLRDAVDSTLSTASATSIVIYGSGEEQATEMSPLMSIARRTRNSHSTVVRKLVVSRERFQSETTFRRRCAILREAGEFSEIGLWDEPDGEFLPQMIIEAHGRSVAWASERETGIHVRGQQPGFPVVEWLDARVLDSELRSGGNAAMAVIDPHPPIAAKEFFETLLLPTLTKLDPSMPAMLRESVDRVEYRDRYFRSRGSAGAFAALINGVIGHSRPANREIKIVSMSVMERPPGQRISYEDWPSDLERDKDLKASLPGFSVSTVEVSRRNAPHQRTLDVYFDDGRVLQIMLDPGVDYWERTRGLAIAPKARNTQNGEKQIVIARLEAADAE